MLLFLEKKAKNECLKKKKKSGGHVVPDKYGTSATCCFKDKLQLPNS